MFLTSSFDFILDVVGGGDAFKEVAQIIVELGLSNNVNILGLVSDKIQLKALYNNADAFVFTSHDEGFPRVLYEAMASGLPIFTTFVGGIPGRMIDGKNCFEIPVRDSRGSAGIIIQNLLDLKTMELVARAAQTMLYEILEGKLLSHDEKLIKVLNNEN